MYACVKKEKHTLFFLNTFIDYFGKNTVVDIVGILQRRIKHWPGLERTEVFFLHHSRMLPNEREKGMYDNSVKFSFCIKQNRIIVGIKHHLW